jgi:hypothetical protein
MIFVLFSMSGSVETLRLAMKQKNIDTLDTYVDFESIQQSWKQQIKLEFLLRTSINNQEVAEIESVDMIEIALASNLAEDLIDLYVSRVGLVRLFRLNEGGYRSPKASEAKKLFSVLSSDNFINRHDRKFTSWNKFEVRGYDARGRKYVLVFTFDYIRWVLTDIVIDLSSFEQEKVINFIKSLHLENLYYLSGQKFFMLRPSIKQ